MTTIAIVFGEVVGNKNKESCENKLKVLYGDDAFVWFYPKSELEERLKKFGDNQRTLRGYFELRSKEEKVICIGNKSVEYILVTTS